MISLNWQEVWWTLPELRRMTSSIWTFRAQQDGRVHLTVSSGEEVLTYLFKTRADEEDASSYPFLRESLLLLIKSPEPMGRDIEIERGRSGRPRLTIYHGHKRVDIRGITSGEHDWPRVKLPRRSKEAVDASAWWEAFRWAAEFTNSDDPIASVGCVHMSVRSYVKATNRKQAIVLHVPNPWLDQGVAGPISIPATRYLSRKRSTFPFKHCSAVYKQNRLYLTCRPWYYSVACPPPEHYPIVEF